MGILITLNVLPRFHTFNFTAYSYEIQGLLPMLSAQRAKFSCRYGDRAAINGTHKREWAMETSRERPVCQ